MPRMKAIASAMPVAAETKLWKARPAIYVGGREGKEGDGHDRE
jgi:hypothetical protein